MKLFYILDENHNPVAVNSLVEVARWAEANPEAMNIAYSEIGTTKLSTIFITVADTLTMQPYFETMLTDSDRRTLIKRYSTWQKAELEHRVLKNALQTLLEFEAEAEII